MHAPINIQITNDNQFLDVAFLVDRLDFLKEIEQLRNQYRLDKKAFPEGTNYLWELKNWGITPELEEEFNTKEDPIQEKLQDTNYTFKLDIEAKEVLTNELRKVERILPNLRFKQDVKEIRRKFKKTPVFDKIISSVVKNGIVTDEDYVTCDMKIDYPEAEWIDFEKETRIVIVVNPNVKIKDIEKLLEEKGERIFKEYEEKILEGKINEYDTRGNIKRDRSWYWKKKDMSYQQIIDEEERKNPDAQIVFRDTVIKAVIAYRKALAVEI